MTETKEERRLTSAEFDDFMKNDLREIRHDLKEIKSDLKDIRADLKVIRTDLQEMRCDIRELNVRVEQLAKSMKFDQAVILLAVIVSVIMHFLFK